MCNTCDYADDPCPESRAPIFIDRGFRRLSHNRKSPGAVTSSPERDQHWSADMSKPIPEDAGWYLDEFDAERFWDHIKLNGGTPYEDDPYATAQGQCWLWNGGEGHESYGRFRIFGQWQQAHRIAYKDFGKKLTDDQVIDHLCRIRGCVNPAHLEATTQLVNVQRNSRTQREACINGHLYTDKTLVTSERNGRTFCRCRTCESTQRAEQYQARKALA
jgi:hypothetical protein